MVMTITMQKVSLIGQLIQKVETDRRTRPTLLSWWLTHTHTHTRLTALFLGLPGWAGTRKVKPIWILLKQETVSGSGISWAVCKSAPRSRQITMPTPHHSVFYRPHALSATQPTASKHWRPILMANMVGNHFDQLLINVACVCVYVIVCRSSRPASWRHTWDQFTARWTTRCDDVNSC